MGQGLREKLQAKREEYETFVTEEFRAGFTTLFDQFPEMDHVTWKQYTPFWNDGDECLFRTGARDADIFDEKGEELGYWFTEYSKERMNLLCKTVQDFLNEFDIADYRVMFGDHVSVTVARSGVTIDEFTEHD